MLMSVIFVVELQEMVVTTVSMSSKNSAIVPLSLYVIVTQEIFYEN